MFIWLLNFVNNHCLQWTNNTSVISKWGTFPANICWSWRRLQHVFSVTILCLARRLQSVLEDEKLLHWRRLQDVLNTCLEEVLKTLWTQTKYIMGISVSNKPKCVSNKSIFYISMFDNSKTKPKGIN